MLRRSYRPTNPTSAAVRRYRLPLRLERLEERSVPAVFTVTNALDSGANSLRQALLNANASPGLDEVRFNLPGSGVRVINLLSALPASTGPIVIDAATQPGYAGTPLVELNGASAGAAADGLRLDGGGSTLRGLAVTRFAGAAVRLRGAGNVLTGNVLGADPAVAPGRGNGIGVLVENSSSNRVGTDGDGVNDAAEANAILGNAQNGVTVVGASVGNAVRGNLLVGNGRLAIDLGNNGVTANDPGDPDTGPNQLQNDPVVQAAFGGAATRVVGTLDSVANTTFTLDFYAGALPDPTGTGEGMRWLGSAVVITDAGGAASFDMTLAAASAGGEWVAATATGPDGTSEFSAARRINRPPTLGPVADQFVSEGGTVSFSASAADPDNVATVAYAVPAGTVGTQTFNGTLGMDFDVTAPVRITHLGVFDDGSNGLAVPLTTRLYNRDDTATPLATLVFAAGSTGTLIGGSRFLPLAAPLVLPAGFRATIVAENYGPAERNANSVFGVGTADPGDGSLVFVGGARFGARGAFPTAVDAGPVNRYGAGTLIFEEVDRLTYSLEGAPAGAAIDPISGAFSWSPAEADGPASHTFTVRVTDAGAPALSATISVTVHVGEVNLPPAFDDIPDQTATEHQTFTVTATATDPDLPANGLTFSLTDAPAGATIDSVTGVITWTPDETQGGAGYAFTVVVAEDGPSGLSDQQTFTVTVTEDNRAPVLGMLADHTIEVGQTLSFTAAATDLDLPANGLTFSLDPGAPVGASIDPTTGAFAWTPLASAEGRTFTIMVRVTDDGSPALSDVRSFTVTVPDRPDPPAAGIAGPTAGVRWQPLTYTLGSGAAGGPVSFRINWGDGTTQTVNGPVGTPVVHAFPRTGSFTVRVAAGDGPAATLVVRVKSVLAEGGTLYVGGTSRDDVILVGNAPRDRLRVLVNGNVSTQARPGQVVVFGGPGDDLIALGDHVAVPALLFGGVGDDSLSGGRGDDVLVGGNGRDWLDGGRGRDILIGGRGADRLRGRQGEDLLIDGWTDFDETVAALGALRAEWTSSRDYEQRQANLLGPGTDDRANGDVFLLADGPTATVFEDAVRDRLRGGNGRDWFFADVADPISDFLPDRAANEDVD